MDWSLLNKLKKLLPGFIRKIKTDLLKTWEAIFSKHNSALLFNPVKVAETFNFVFSNIGPNIAKRIPKGKKSPMTYLNDKIWKSFYFYPTTADEIIKIMKSFSNIKSSGPNSLPTPVLKRCADSCLSGCHI